MSKTRKLVGTLIFLAIFLGLFCAIGSQMGAANMLSTMMNTAFDLLLNTVFYIMAIAVLAGAVSALFSEFGVVDLVNKLLSPLMKPLFGLPGAASLGIITTYLSDNPAILTLASDNKFRGYFKKYQLPALTNLGTAFGMGLIVTTFMIGIKSPTGENLAVAALIGNLGAVIGSVVSTRLMLLQTKKLFGKDAPCDSLVTKGDADDSGATEKRGVGMRVIDCLMNGGKNGVEMGLDIIPGVLIICTLVMMLTNTAPKNNYVVLERHESYCLVANADDLQEIDDEVALEMAVFSDDDYTLITIDDKQYAVANADRLMVSSKEADAKTGSYTGGAYEGVGFLPWLGEKISFILKPLFGFTSAECIAVPITALGAAGAAIGLVPGMIGSGAATAHDIAVFTAMCMCWSGYLSTHVAMMNSLKSRELTGKAILSHTIGGLCAGIAANWIYQLISLIG